MYVCGGGEEKRKAGGYMGGGEKIKEIKEKKERPNCIITPWDLVQLQTDSLEF